MVSRELLYIIGGTSFGLVLGLDYSAHPFYTLMWTMFLGFTYSKKKNHFVSLLLVLELLAIVSLWLLMTSFMKGMISFIFILLLITIIVGGAGLGLGLLVTLVRLSTKELVISKNI